MVATPLICISDDLTGAVACGAELRRHHLSVAVGSWRTALRDDVDANIIDTASRLLPAAEAARRVAAVLDDRGDRNVYKRIDSRLRGNIAAELDALTEALARPALIAAAAPAWGITTNAGVQLSGADPLQVDPLEGPSSPRLAEMLGGVVVELPARPSGADLGRSLAAARYVVCDATSLADLAALAETVRQLAAPFVAVGSYGFASALAQTHARARIVVVAGSRDPVSERQLALAQHDMDAVVIRGDSQTVSTELLLAVEREPPDGVILIGGETASAVVQACGVEWMDIVAEPWPATPLVQFVGGALDGIRGIVKSGGRGDDTWLLYAAGMLT